jgi:hypothetical protein
MAVTLRENRCATFPTIFQAIEIARMPRSTTNISIRIYSKIGSKHHNNRIASEEDGTPFPSTQAHGDRIPLPRHQTPALTIKYILDVWEVLMYNHPLRPFDPAPKRSRLTISSRQSLSPATPTRNNNAHSMLCHAIPC